MVTKKMERTDAPKTFMCGVNVDSVNRINRAASPLVLGRLVRGVSGSWHYC